jgi:RNA polymerase sigma-70 factor (ECF subfamily)
MAKSTDITIEQAIERHADTVMRVCTVYLRERADREDAFQETFLRYARHKNPFESDEHRKAWLIRVASNICKDMLKSSSAKTESLDILEDSGYSPQGDDGQEGQRALEQQEVIAALRKIDERYRLPLFLKYYEGYTAAEIAHTLQIPENTVYTNISRGKAQLKGVLSHGR